MASLLFITTLSISANPRLYKEILCAEEAGHDIHVLCFRLGNWTDAQDDEKVAALPGVKFIRLSATRAPFVPWLIASMMERFARKLVSRWKHPQIDSLSAGKRAFILELKLSRWRIRPDWVIAHNPAAFLPAKRFAARTGARLGIDIEDYHPGEISDPRLTDAMRRLMRHTLSVADYVSFAAPLIRRETARDLGGEQASWMTILNWFPSAEFLPPPTPTTGPLRLVWFSQVVTARRGLELVLPAIMAAGERVELHIFGYPDPAFTDLHVRHARNIFLHGPVRQSELHQKLAGFDIGLAIDIVADRNRELAITNKILAYLQAGLFLAVTDTEAQRSFMGDYPAHGLLFSPDPAAWESLLNKLLERKENIRSAHPERFNTMRIVGWEQTSSELRHHWASPTL
jgi:glycosyltransferase involved in cell wall biosynthesis